jgi:hypothetical protein
VRFVPPVAAIIYSAQCNAHICAVHSAQLLALEFIDIVFSFVWFNRFGDLLIDMIRCSLAVQIFRFKLLKA